MKKKLIFFILLCILASSIVTKHRDSENYDKKISNFHIQQVGKDSVIRFSRKHPTIINNREVYLAYLQNFHPNSDEYISLLKDKIR